MAQRTRNYASFLLLVVGYSFAFFVLLASRADNQAELHSLLFYDVLIGVMLTTGCLLRVGTDKFSVIMRFSVRLMKIVLLAGLPLFALIWFQYSAANIRWRSPNQKTEFQLNDLFYHALEEYKTDCGDYPSEKEGLRALVENPQVRGWKGPYAPEEFLRDGWGQEIRYQLNLQDGKPIVWSIGADGLDGTSDDIIRPRLVKRD
ncbi:type II secretion system protein GspG [Telmatocola sphagniphila]|uniref:Type II secretion system protein GspG n=1 Tax=Telmatocola sphagniphila TaxID=1123043 RepID=A0A8E6B5H3_9BACT|nr:type II secretion system protein GspG [Telmatocola sphagniphila]QVL31829.1 type II secretion system protein GspG [Telmatocola sphagniphila]